jgi:cytoskeleton protein RodZ
MMPSDHNMTEADRGCGQRLRAAREAAGLEIAEVAERLKMPVRVVESLEAEDWSRLGAPVFIRGQLRSYARLLGLPTESVHVASGVAPIEPTRLAPRTYTPPLQRFAEQAARRMVYVVITAAIAVPVWLATRPHLALPEQSASLDVPAVQTPRDRQPEPAAARQQPAPVVASLAPVPQHATPPVPDLVLRLHEDSWVEVIAPDGGTVEQALLRQGEERSYAPGQVGRVVLGNASAVEVSHRGVVQDLSPYLRANVARFTVSSDGSLAPATQ